MTTQSVQVKLELGHRANIRDKLTPQGFTHDWLVFVRGPEGSNIHHFVDKVVFQLHESFPKPRRVVKEPPYEVAESGYAGFLMTIEVHFRSKEEPKKVNLNYDLFLNIEQQPPVNHIRCEKLTFHNPTEDFRRKLLKAGGVGVLPTDPSIPTSPTPPTFPVSEGGIGGKPLPPSFTDTSLYAKGKPQAAASSLQVGKKYKTQTAKDGSKTSSKPVKEHKEGKTASKEPKPSSKDPKATSKEPKTGSKEPKSSFKEPKPSSKDPKTGSKEPKMVSKEPKTGSKEPKMGSKEPKTGSKEPKSSSIKDPKVSSKDTKAPSKEGKPTSKDPKSTSKEQKTSPKPPPKDHTKTKPSSKRPASTSPAPASSSQDSTKKRKRSSSAKEKDSSDRGPHEKSTSGKPSPVEKGSLGDKPKPKEKSSKPKLAKPPSVSRSDTGLFAPEISVSRKPSKTLVEPPKELPPFEDELSTGEGGEAHSPSSSISFSSLPRGGGGVLNTLMAELGDENDDDDDDDDQDIGLPYRKTPSPIPLLPPLSNHSTSSNEQDYNIKFTSTAPVTSEKAKSSQKSNKKNSTSNGTKKNSYISKGERKQKSSDSKQKSTDAKQKTQDSKPKSSDGKQKSSENKLKTADAKQKHSDSKQKGGDSKHKTTESKSKPDAKLSKGNSGYLNDLVLLHQKLSCLQNREQLQRVVDLIEETGLFHISDATFDFDLCSLDQMTLKKLQECVSLFA